MRQREGKSYEEKNEMNSITVSDGFVTFTKHLRYIERFVSYNVHNNYVFDRRLAPDSS